MKTVRSISSQRLAWRMFSIAVFCVQPFIISELKAQAGTLISVGNNAYGQLGDGTMTSRHVTAPVADDVKFVAAGGVFSLWITDDGVLWGSGINNYGQLGDGTTTTAISPIPVAVDVAKVAAGAEHTIFLKTDGSLWGMGRNSFGQLGIGTTVSHSSPVQIATGVSAIAVGGYHSMFVKTDGTLWATGYNAYGQLGTGNTVQLLSPVQIASNVSSVGCGSYHTLFVDNGGSLRTMGMNSGGQLGDGTTTSRSTPVLVGTGAVTAVGGGNFSLILNADASLWAVGNNSFGQLGDGTATSRLTPVPIASDVGKIAAGNAHSAFVKTDGSLWTMGNNTDGVLADLTSANRRTPVQVGGRILAIAAGAFHTLYVIGPDDPLDPDWDGDGVPDAIDKCPELFNPGQEDSDGDGIGDVCEQLEDTILDFSIPLNLSQIFTASDSSGNQGKRWRMEISMPEAEVRIGETIRGRVTFGAGTALRLSDPSGNFFRVGTTVGYEQAQMEFRNSGPAVLSGIRAEFSFLGVDGPLLLNPIQRQGGISYNGIFAQFVEHLIGTGTSARFEGFDYEITLLSGEPRKFTTVIFTFLAKEITFEATAQPPSITSALNAGGVVGVPFNYAITGTNEPTTFGASGLPDGLVLDSGTGVISGLPQAAGAFQVEITASNQAGTDTATLAMDIDKGIASVAVEGLNHVYDGASKAVAAFTDPGGLDVEISYDGSPLPPTGAGSYAVVAMIVNPNYQGSTTGTLEIARAAAIVEISGYSVTFDGNAHTATGTATGADGTDLSTLLNLSGTTHSGAGSYPMDTWIFTGDANHVEASGTVSNVIFNAELIVVTESATRTFGEPNPVLSATMSGFVPGEDESALGGTLALVTPAVALSPVGTYPIEASGLVSANYTIRYHPGVLNVLPATMTVEIFDPSSGHLARVGESMAFNALYSPSGVSGDYEASWNFSRAGGLEFSLPGTIAGEAVVDSLSFAEQGVYTIELKVIDSAGVEASANTVENDLPAYVVVFDPTGGYVTGGGWVYSLPGALLTEFGASAEGRATFGFVAKYEHGANVPKGNTEFQFRAGDLNFKSTAYEWLVIAGARAQYRGTGSINGEPGFGFMLTAIDGNKLGTGLPDRFRIKIWTASGGAVIYDNQRDTGDNAELDDATVIGGGSIVIHDPPKNGS